jgi:uncharacterized protein YsxB (DUF464 family)
MIQVTVFRDSEQSYCGYTVSGHAGFAEAGKDIICACVSILTQNTANSIERFTDDSIRGEMGEDGYLRVEFPDGIGAESKLLMDSMISGLQDIAETYGKRYLKIRFKEV